MGHELKVLPGGEAAIVEEKLLDDDLMRLVRRGVESAFAALIRRHQALVLGYATRFFGDGQLGREVAQEVFLVVWGERQSYEPQGRFRSYLMTLAHHRCHVVARQRRSGAAKVAALQVEGTALSGGEEATALGQLLAAERQAELARALLGLDDKTRAALSLRFSGELSYEEMSAVTGLPEGTLKAQVCRGLRKLHERLFAEEGP
ncbi:MAG: sigma-70 family RNA polymerase sigma factor [Deltaproteobacteria bacterium]|nr:sigma-70 family RNA polymerase sigma factor [Deltaproteobacteria bacterium]